MKKSKKTTSSLAYKNSPSPMPVLLFLLGILSLFIFVENFFTVISYIKPLGIEKALAIEEIKDAATLLSPTPTSDETILFSLATFTATPTPTSTPFFQEKPKGDFCMNVPIFMYHHVQPMNIAVKEGHGQLTVDSNTFDQQMAYLLSLGYTMISTKDVVQALLDHQQLPEKSIVITIDDGYKDNYEYAYQTAKKYNIKIDFMIPTGLIENPGYMTWDDLREMSQNPLVTLYNHTWSHAALGGADRSKIVAEVMQAQKQLEENLGVKNSVIVYPYGSFSPFAIKVLNEQGFTAGLTTIQGTLQCKSTIMELQRTRIGNTSLSFYGY